MKKTIAGFMLGVFLLTGGCALLTKETGNITIERQKFVNFYAVVKVLYAKLRANAEFGRNCSEVLMNCEDLRLLDLQVKAVDVQIQAKLEVPESEIDWAVIKELVTVLVKLVP